MNPIREAIEALEFHEFCDFGCASELKNPEDCDCGAFKNRQALASLRTLEAKAVGVERPIRIEDTLKTTASESRINFIKYSRENEKYIDHLESIMGVKK